MGFNGCVFEGRALLRRTSRVVIVASATTEDEYANARLPRLQAGCIDLLYAQHAFRSRDGLLGGNVTLELAASRAHAARKNAVVARHSFKRTPLPEVVETVSAIVLVSESIPLTFAYRVPLYGYFIVIRRITAVRRETLWRLLAWVLRVTLRGVATGIHVKLHVGRLGELVFEPTLPWKDSK